MSDIARAFDLFGFTQTAIGKWIFATFVLLALVLAVITMVQKISQAIGKPVSWAKDRKHDHEEINQIQERLEKLQKQQDQDRQNSISHDKKIQQRQDDIYNMLIDMQIKNYRWEIVDFSSRLSNGGKANKQSYDHILDSYTQYQALLKKLGRENGKTQASMDVIRKKYQEHLENGF